jgi:hypothetical protein
VFVEELAENFFDWGKGTVQELRGRKNSAIASRYQRTGDDTTD